MRTNLSLRKLLILSGACLFQCALIGVLVNSSGVLMAQIRTEFQLPLSRISTYHMIKSLTGAFTGAITTALFFRTKKPVFMGSMILLSTVSFLILIPGAQWEWVWWLSAALYGIAFSTQAVMIPFVLLQHFPEKSGTVTGIAMAFSGLGGIFFNPVTAALIENWGWRMAILVLSGITLVMAVISLVILFSEKTVQEPASMPAVRKKQKFSFQDSFPMRKFLLCTAALFCSAMVMQFCQYVTMYAQDVGYSLKVGAALTSVFMVGNVGGKLLFGYGCDKIGVYRSMMATMGIISLGSLLLVFFHQYLPVLYIAVLFYGMIYSLTVISVSRCAVETYGAEDAKKYMGLHTSINGFLQAAAAMSVGLLYDATGSFQAQLLLGVGFMAFSAWACWMLLRMRRVEDK